MDSGVEITGTAQREAWLARQVPPVEQLRADLWSIPVPMPDNPLRYVTSYVFALAGGGLGLVDTGWDSADAWTSLQAGLTAIGALGYSAYLGGHMVYELGVGIKDRGLNEERAPELRMDNVGEAARVALENLGAGARSTVAEIAGGELVPVLTRSREPDDAGFRVEGDERGFSVQG